MNLYRPVYKLTNAFDLTVSFFSPKCVFFSSHFSIYFFLHTVSLRTKCKVCASEVKWNSPKSPLSQSMSNQSFFQGPKHKLHASFWKQVIVVAFFGASHLNFISAMPIFSSSSNFMHSILFFKLVQSLNVTAIKKKNDEHLFIAICSNTTGNKVYRREMKKKQSSKIIGQSSGK